ncbi:MAG: hypothetical protein M3Z35_10230, partial [Nitrospirota bacterium]|nr:hypothetical protein [Nitrospirota bacterium]
MLYEQLFKSLHTHRIRYLIVGAVAVNLHGIPRMTADLDVMVDLGEENVHRFIEMIVGLGYKPRVPVQPFDFLDAAKRREWRETKSMVVFTWLNPSRPYEEIDVFLDNPIDFSLAFSRKTSLPLQDFTVLIASVPDLIALKR